LDCEGEESEFEEMEEEDEENEAALDKVAIVSEKQ
jgi:hypothetical protein